MNELLRLMVAFFAVLLFAGAAPAQDQVSEEEYLRALDAALPGDLMNNPLDPKWRAFGEDYSRKVVGADQIPGRKALQIKVRRAKQNPWDVSVQGDVGAPVKAGDVILIGFWARAPKPDKSTGLGHVQMRFQQKADPYVGVVEGEVTLLSRWQLHYLSGVAPRDFSADEINVSFNVGHHRQTVEFGMYYLNNLGPDTDMSSLPSGSVDP